MLKSCNELNSLNLFGFLLCAVRAMQKEYSCVNNHCGILGSSRDIHLFIYLANTCYVPGIVLKSELLDYHIPVSWELVLEQ